MNSTQLSVEYYITIFVIMQPATDNESKKAGNSPRLELFAIPAYALPIRPGADSQRLLS